MIINNNSAEQINVALLDLEKKLLAIKDDKRAIGSLRDSVNAIKASLNETKAGLTSGATYNINITGNATTATTATTAGSAVSAESAESASKDGNGNSITSTYATKEELAYVNNELNIAKKSIVPVGVIYPFGGSNKKVPDGYLPCDGRAVSRTQYSALFNVIGTSFGNGDGINTFNVPDMRGRFPEGANGNLGNRIEAGLPNITGNLNSIMTDGGGSFSGAFYYNGKPRTRGWMGVDADEVRHIGFDASRLPNSLYGKSSTVQPPAVCVNYIIKY